MREYIKVTDPMGSRILIFTKYITQIEESDLCDDPPCTIYLSDGSTIRTKEDFDEIYKKLFPSY